MTEVLKNHLPESAIDLAIKWWNELDFQLKIAKGRKSKLGDFRPAHNGNPPRISVNGDLGPFHFLITYTHEVAHAFTWEKYGRKVKAHGIEWQFIYSELLKELIQLDIFPKEIKSEVIRHSNQPKASSCSDPALYKLLNQIEKGDDVLYLEELAEGSSFLIGGNRRFIKGAKRRTRYECIDLNNKRTYFVSGHAEVKELID